MHIFIVELAFVIFLVLLFTTSAGLVAWVLFTLVEIIFRANKRLSVRKKWTLKSINRKYRRNRRRRRKRFKMSEAEGGVIICPHCGARIEPEPPLDELGHLADFHPEVIYRELTRVRTKAVKILALRTHFGTQRGRRWLRGTSIFWFKPED